MRKINNKGFLNLPTFVTDYIGMALALALLLVIFGISAQNFFTLTTFRTIANQIPDITIVAVGMTFVLIIAGIDLSVGSVMALASAVLGLSLVKFNFPLPAAIAVCLVVGILCGTANGLVIIRWKLPAFIVTLGMLEIARGAAYLVTDSRTIYIGGPVEVIADESILGHSLPVIIAVAIVIAGQLVLSRTVFGRYLVAIGTNEEAVRLSGINPGPIKFAVFVICGACSALAGMIQASKMSSASPNAGIGFELTVIAAVVIGGTSLMGGRGSVVKSFLGVVIVAVLNAGLAQIGAPEYAKRTIIGIVIVLAVILDSLRSRKSKLKIS